MRIVFATLIALLYGSSAAIAAEPIMGPIAIERTPDGGVAVHGTTKHLPAGTELMVTFGPSKKSFGEDKVAVQPDGTFRAGPFMNHTKPWSAGNYSVEVISYFTGPWQSCDILHRVGVETDSECKTAFHVNPKLLPIAADLVPDDPEFPQAGRHLEVRTRLVLSGLTPSLLAVDAVKKARIDVMGKGHSAYSIREVVSSLCSAGCTPTGWSAQPSGVAGHWTVTFAYLEEGAAMVKKQAQWDYDSVTKRVKYLDPRAKMFSWEE
jgi:hypothetical protein